MLYTANMQLKISKLPPVSLEVRENTIEKKDSFEYIFFSDPAPRWAGQVI